MKPKAKGGNNKMMKNRKLRGLVRTLERISQGLTRLTLHNKKLMRELSLNKTTPEERSNHVESTTIKEKYGL